MEFVFTESSLSLFTFLEGNPIGFTGGTAMIDETTAESTDGMEGKGTEGEGGKTIREDS